MQKHNPFVLSESRSDLYRRIRTNLYGDKDQMKYFGVRMVRYTKRGLALTTNGIIFFIVFSLNAESFLAPKPKRQKKESKQELLEEIGSFHAQLPKDIADMLEELADVQKEYARLQRASIDTALEVVSGDYCPKATKEELAAKRDEAKKMQQEVARIAEGVKTLKREIKKVGN